MTTKDDDDGDKGWKSEVKRSPYHHPSWKAIMWPSNPPWKEGFLLIFNIDNKGKSVAFSFWKFNSQ